MGDGFSALQATIAACGMFLPGILEVKHHDPNDARKQRDLRFGMFLAGGWSFIVAAHFANKSNSHTPYLYWLGGMGTMLILYEWQFRSADDIDLRPDNGGN